MSPAKKPPRPVTAWCGWSRWRGKTWLTFGSGVSMVRENIVPDAKADDSGAVKVRIVPIRPATDAEIERLAKALAKASGLHEMDQARFVLVFSNVARAAWKRGAR